MNVREEASAESEVNAMSPATRLLAALGIAAILVAGIFLWGRVAATDRLAMLFTTLWFGLVLVAAFVVARSRPALKAPFAAGYIVVAIGAFVVLALPMFSSREIDEDVVTGAPAAEADGSANVQIASGDFAPLSHPGSGTAAVVELENGDRKLTLTGFETDNGPDLRVYLTTGDPTSGAEIGDSVDLGALKGNVGDQQYDIPADVDLERFSNVVVWCRAFSVGFTAAPLTS